MRSLILATTLLAFLGPSAFAQTQTRSPTNNSQMDAASSQKDQTSPDNAQNNSPAQNSPAIQQIRQDLEKAGFTDVKVVARSFVVQAKSKDGSPVVMTIGPHGMSVFEAMSSGRSNSGTVGSSAGGLNSSNSDTGASGTQNQGMRK